MTAAPASSPDACTLDAGALEHLFPCRFFLDGDMMVRRPSTALAALGPGVEDGQAFADLFSVAGGPQPACLDDLLACGSRNLVLVHRGEARLRLKTALARQPGGEVLVLLSPIVADGRTAMQLGIDLSCLSPFDGSVELVMAGEMQRIMTREAQDLAENLKRTRDEAIERQAFFDAILRILPTILMVKDARDGRYVLVNRAAEEILGFRAEDVVGKSVFELFPADEAEMFAAEDAEVIASREVNVTEDESVTTAQAGRRTFRTKKVATYGPEGPRYVVTVGEDVTDQRQTARALEAALVSAEEAAQAKTVFLANMSHEIRTPLNGIVAIADILSRTPLDTRSRDLVEIIRSSGETLERLLSDILDQARIESGQIALEAAPFHLGDAIRATAALADMRAREKGVALSVELADDVDGVVLGDMVRVRQIVGNLVSNAVKFTEAGSVRVSGRRTAEGLVRIEVRDTGPGFDEATRERIFARFQQADSSITRRFGGTGLGLAISRELAELMGGELGCTSTPGEGSCFWLEAPLEASAAPLADAVAAEVESVPDRLRILVADDHPTNRRVVQLMLQDSAEVVCVENGQEALDAMAAGDFDLVLMDMQMPVMDGLTAIRHQRARELSGSVRTPIIMLTANALPEHVAASREAGADRHLDKPITAASLFTAISETLNPASACAAA
jgi:PAS domain S-box-containing protein